MKHYADSYQAVESLVQSGRVLNEDLDGLCRVMSNYLYGGVLQHTDHGCVSFRSLVPYAVNSYIKITNSGASKGPLNIGTAMTQITLWSHALIGFIVNTGKWQWYLHCSFGAIVIYSLHFFKQNILKWHPEDTNINNKKKINYGNIYIFLFE